MKPPSTKSGGRDGSGKTPFRAGGPRPATPRPPGAKPARARGERTAPAAPEVKPRAATDRPVLTVATKGAFGREDPPSREAVSPRPSRAPQRPVAARAPAPRPEIDAPRGTLWLYGTHAVAAALTNPARRLRRLMLTEEAETAVAAIVPQPWPIQAERTDRARLDQLLGRETVHQGAALLADPLGSPSLAQALERSGPVLVLDQVSDPRNVGAIIRSAAAFGVAAIVMQDRNAPDETGALAKSASGALERVPILRAVNIARTLVALKAAGLWVVGLDASGAPLSGPALASRRVVLVLGSEGEGMRRLTREGCDELAGISMPGGVGSALDSLNVSAAATVALYELGRK